MHHFAEFIHLYGYVGMFIVVFLESSIIFPLPGDSLLFTAGIFAAQGKFGMNYYILLAVFFVSTFTGSLFGYYVGHHAVRLRKYQMFKNLLAEEHIEKVREFFHKYGKPAMLVSRFVPIVRTFAPVAAGMGRMNFPLFVRYNILGALLWSVVMTSLGFHLGRAFPEITEYLSIVVVVVILIAISPPFIHKYMKRRRRGNDK